ncbi:hypothetical protein [Blastococcus sp. SYSU D00820]
MEDTQRDARMTDESTADRSADDSSNQQTSAVPVARLLANPRRVRRA